MHPLDRLNRAMPFLVMFYLMSSLVQLHVTSWMAAPFDPSENATNGGNLIAHLKSGLNDFSKHSDRAFAYYDETQYAFADMLTP
jgi:hypothetical protein